MIYALIDQETLRKRDISLRDILLHIQSLSIPILQYRNKYGSMAEIMEALETIRALYGGNLIVNDAVELISYADGVHLGQEDILRYGRNKREAVDMIRQKTGRKTVGLSTHNAAEILEANELDIDYIGLGAYRATGTKKDAEVGGESLLEIARLSRHPVALIGGVRMVDIFDRSITYRVIGSDLYRYFHL
jgi:thiamine-phosphate pyrophosphorylase